MSTAGKCAQAAVGRRVLKGTLCAVLNPRRSSVGHWRVGCRSLNGTSGRATCICASRPWNLTGSRAGLLPAGVAEDGQAESSWVLPLRGTGQAGAAGSPRGQGGRWAGGAPTSRPTACGARGDQLLPNGAPAVPRRGQRVAKERGSFAIAEVGVTGRLQ